MPVAESARYACAADPSEGVGWDCEAGVCRPGIVGLPLVEEAPDPELRIPERCALAVLAAAPLGSCQGAITAEARRLLSEFAHVLSVVCRSGACAEPFMAASRALHALARARQFLHV